MSAIDITPSWSAAIAICIAALEDGTEYGKRLARAELHSMGKHLDSAFPGRGPDVQSTVNPSHWDEQPGAPVDDWRDEVANDDTRLGYLAWCEARIDNGVVEACPDCGFYNDEDALYCRACSTKLVTQS